MPVCIKLGGVFIFHNSNWQISLLIVVIGLIVFCSVGFLFKHEQILGFIAEKISALDSDYVRDRDQLIHFCNNADTTQACFDDTGSNGQLKIYGLIKKVELASKPVFDQLGTHLGESEVTLEVATLSPDSKSVRKFKLSRLFKTKNSEVIYLPNMRLVGPYSSGTANKFSQSMISLHQFLNGKFIIVKFGNVAIENTQNKVALTSPHIFMDILSNKLPADQILLPSSSELYETVNEYNSQPKQ